LKIAIAVSGLACNGAVMYAKRLVSLLKDRGHSIWLLAENGSWITQNVGDGAKLFVTDFRRRTSEFQKVAAFCREEGIDILHSHTTSASSFAAILRLFFGIRTIAHLHNNNFAPHAWFQSHVLAVSLHTLRCHQYRLAGICGSGSVLHNFVDPAVFHRRESPDRLRELLGVDPDVPVLLVSGNICHRKGQDLAVRSMAEIRKYVPNAILALAGTGRLPQSLEEPYVRFLGHRDDLPELLPFATVLLVPSRSEPFSLAAVEAMACQVPVIVTAAGGIEEVAANGGGIIVRRRSADALANAAVRLLVDPVERQRQAMAGFDRTQKHFGIPQHLDALEQRYYQVKSVSGQSQRRS